MKHWKQKVLSAKRQQPKCVLAVQRQRKQTWDFLQPALRDRAVVPKKSLLGLCIWAVHCMRQVTVERHVFSGDREQVRKQAVDAALDLAIRCLDKE